MDFQKLQATAIVRTNSISFVEQVFTLSQARQPMVMVASQAQAEGLPGIQIDDCIVPDDRTGWFTSRHALIHDNVPAQVSYTSGTEGQPKGILLTHANLADAAQRIIEQMQMTSQVREYVGVPATFSFGMGRYRAISAVGGQAYLPPRGFDPLELARMLTSGEVNSLAVVPTLLRVLLASPDAIGDAGKNLRWMEIGSQHMTAGEKLRTRELFPNARIVQHYGLTEASRSTFLQVSDVPQDLLGSVGRPVGQTELQLGADGRIRIRGPHVAKSRIDADGLHDLQDVDGWLQTNDLGHLQDGYLFFDGRADDLINCGGVKVVPDRLEDRIRARLDGAAVIAVAKIPDAQRGDGVLVAVQGNTPPADQVKKVAEQALKDMGVVAGDALHVFVVDALPVTGTGKVQRSVLAERFSAQQQSMPAEAVERKEGVRDVRSLFEHEFPGQVVKPEDTFESLGGDSLRYIQFSLGFEQRFGQLPVDWEHLSARELQATVDTSKKQTWRRLESETFLRAFFMICIVALHTEAFIYSPNWGAAYFLYLLAGYSVARFQLPEIIRTGSVRTIVGTIRYVAIPTILVVISLHILTGTFEITSLFLVSNFLDPNTIDGFSFYFVEIFVQLLVLAAIFFSFSRMRNAFRVRPFISSLVLLAVVIVITRTIEANMNADYNYHRTPWHYSWPFVLGMVLATAPDLRAKLFCLVLSTVLVLEFWGLTTASLYVGGACAIVLFVRAFIVPAPVKIIVAEIAGASLFIYLSHYQIISIDLKLFGQAHPWGQLVVSIIVGIVGAHIYTWGERKFFRATNLALRGDRQSL